MEHARHRVKQARYSVKLARPLILLYPAGGVVVVP